MLSIYESDSDSSSANAKIALDELAKLKHMLLNNYKYYLKNEQEAEILKKLKLTENEIKRNLINIKIINTPDIVNTKEEETKAKSR